MTLILPSKYVLDTSLFTQAKRSYYAFDIARSFWQHLVKSANQGIITSIDKVYNEIKRGQDDLYDWVKKELPPQFFCSTGNLLTIYQQLITWSSSNNQYTENAKVEFAQYDEADTWIVAYALSNRLTIVSQEIFDPKIKRKIPIPNVCKVFDVRYIDTFTFLRECNFSM
ncbi:MAG: DUF4411 family protein [Candidatus Brocadia sp.]|nr:DUF4411 family protein [Candidatus Brocadia sp.]